MTTTTNTVPARSTSLPITPTSLWRQSWIMVKRNLIHTKRMPEMLADVTFQPIMFVLLFAFVFGSAIAVPGSGNYREFLLPGIMGQTIAFTAFIVATGVTADLEKGIIDRFRSLPIHQSSVIVGRAIAAVLHSSIGIVVMAVTGLAIGWRIRTSVPEAVLGFALVLLFGFAMIWFGLLVGSRFKTVEAVNGFMFTTLFPITFLQRLRAHRGHAELAEDDRRVEPDLIASPGHARAVGQRSRRFRRCALAPAAPRTRDHRLVGPADRGHRPIAISAYYRRTTD